MSQFRIKNIDNAIPDEWVYKVNEGLGAIGDDIDARDPNELAEAILDTQTILLKVSSLASNTILKPNSGLAERITILEGIAGNSALQDIYNNGNTITVIAGKPLIFGMREEFKLDDSGNLSFKPATMKVRGTGFQTLDFTNLSVTTNLGDLLVGATSPGSKLTLKAEDYLYLKDIFLTNPVTLSEPGNSALATESQSIIGAINELKSTSFNTSFQSVYDQSSPPKLTTNVGQGAVIIEDPNTGSSADALRVNGILNVTRKAKVGDLKIGANTTIADATGYLTSDLIKTTNRIETPLISSGASDLTFTDRRVSFPFSDSSVSGLNTTRKSVIGAINELKTDITTVGNTTSLFGNEHDSATGNHKIITTQAEIGANSTKRFVVKNSSNAETFSVTGSGDMVASSATIGGLSVVALLNSLTSHLLNDGTAHSAFSSHIADPNPHNTVKSILNLTGVLSLACPDGSINITTTGSTINFAFNNTVNFQQVYDNLSTKEVALNSSGLSFKDNLNQLIANLNATNFDLYKNLQFNNTNAKIISTNSLNIEPTSGLVLNSVSGDVEIKTTDTSKKVKIQNIDFSETGAETLSPTLGNSVLAAFKKINSDIETSITNGTKNDINTQFPHFIDVYGGAWPYIANLHPANEFVSGVDFFWANQGALFYPQTTIPTSGTGLFYSSGTHNIKATTSGTVPLTFIKGQKLYPICLSYNDLTLTSSTITDGQTILLDQGDLTLTARTNATAANEFRIDTSTNLKVRIDKIRDNIIEAFNKRDAINVTSTKAGIWGNTSRGYLRINAAPTNNQTISIGDGGLSGEATTITLTASTAPSAPDTTTGFTQFLTTTDLGAVATSLADAINRSTFKNPPTDTTSITKGHKVKARAIGQTIILDWYKPGQSGDNATLSGSAISTSSQMTFTAFSGGSSVIRIYDLDIAAPTLLTAETTLTGASFASATFIAKEKTGISNNLFLTADQALSSSRYSPFYNARELGTIEASAGDTITFKIRN